jgi:hypothetical protein
MLPRRDMERLVTRRELTMYETVAMLPFMTAHQAIAS